MSLEDVPRNYPRPRFQAEKYLPALAGKRPPPSCFRFCPGGGEWQKAALVRASVPSSSPSPTPVVLSSPTLPPVCRVLSWLACSSKAAGAFFAQHRPSEPSPTKAASPAPWPGERLKRNLHSTAFLFLSCFPHSLNWFTLEALPSEITCTQILA